MGTPAQTNGTEWTLGKLLNWTTDFLHEHHIDDARLATEVLLAHAADCRRIDLYARFDSTLPRERLDRFRASVRRAAASEPIAYLVGSKEFFSLDLKVTRDVLIPRPETETLVECVIDHCARRGEEGARLLDFGTGSGCIAVAVLKQLTAASAVATDVSPEALAVARENAERHGVADRLELVEADGLALPIEARPEVGFDVLMSNPPYVAEADFAALEPSVRDHEPRAALSDGGDGLSFFRTIARDGPPLLRAGAVVVVEVADGQAQAVTETFAASGTLQHRDTWKDRVTGRERVLVFALSR